MKRNFYIFSALLIGGMFFSQLALAQGGSLSISPIVFELSGNPADVIENYLKVFNLSDSIIVVKMQVEDIAPTGEEGFVTVEPADTETYSLARWIKTDPGEFDLKPGEEKQVKFTLTIPKNAEPGGHYGTILATTRSVAGPGMTGTTIIQRIGALVLLTVPGQMKENLIVSDFTAPGYSEYGPINFSIKLKNIGTVHVKPTAQITVTNWFGKKVADIPIPEKNVLPGGIRKYDVSLNQKLLFAGKYTATLTGTYGSSNTQLGSVVINFWAFPWKFGLGVIIVLVLLLLLRRRIMIAARVLIKGR